MSDPAPVTHFPALDREAARTFLQYLDPDAEKFTFQTFTDSDERKKTYQANPRTGQIIDPMAKVLHGTLDEHWASLVDASRLGAGIFVTVNKTTLCGRRNRENIVGIRVYFVDCDGVPIDEIKAGILALGLMPHIGIQSSSGRYHCYWCVRDAPLTGFTETQKKLIALFGSDPQVCDLPRVMRMPGFPHQKDGSSGELVRLTYTRGGDDILDADFQKALANALMLRAPQRPLKDRALDGFGKPSPDWSQGYAEGQRNNECARRAGSAISEGNAYESVIERCLRWNQLNRPPLSDDEVKVVVGSIWKRHITKPSLVPRLISAGRANSEEAHDKGSEAAHAQGAQSTAGEGRNYKERIIRVLGGGLSNEATAGEAAIIKAGHPVYRREASLVRPVIEEVEATQGRRTKVARLKEITQPYMVDLLCRSAVFERYDGRRRRWVAINPPKEIAQIILHRFGEWTFNRVVGVITTPTLRPDGSLLVTEGYDPATQLILMDPPFMPVIPDRPSRHDALAALKLLDGLLDEFPFADDASRSVALSCLITPIVRGAFTVAPMHAARAPTAGSGKSFLFDIAATIAIGQPCPVMAAGRSEEETEKRLGAALLAGQPIINIDNFNGDLGGDALCQIIERPVVEIRILGKSELVRIESRCTLFATGNNLRLLGDMTRRVVLCTLDARKERPELRQFKRDPVAEVLANRGRYVAAVLTVVRAYLVAGRPGRAPRLPSFEGWSDTVRSPLMWLDRPDPLETMETARKDDPDLQATEAIFAALKEAVGIGEGKALSAAQIIQLASDRTSAQDGSKLRYPALREALLMVPGQRDLVDARELGKWLGRHKGRIAKGLRLEGQADGHGHAAQWWLTSCG